MTGRNLGDKQIKVVQVIGSLGLGGAQNCLKHIVENRSDNVKHYVYSLRAKPADIEVAGDVVNSGYPNYDPRKIVKLVKLCRQYDVDVLHAHLDKAIIACLIASYFCRVKVVVHEHGPVFTDSVKNKLFRFVTRLLKGRASHFIAVSSAAAEQIQKKLGVSKEKISVVHNAVELDKFRLNGEMRKKLRSQFGIADDDIVVGFVGRLSYLKGPDVLMEAFRQAVEINGKLVLVYVGDGDMRERLTQQAESYGIASHVKLLGFCSDVAEVINIFDIAAITSRQEAFGMAGIEFMQMQVPVISTGVGGMSDYMVNGDNAVIVPSGDSEKIAESIKYLVENEQVRQKLVIEGANTAKRFGVERLVEVVEDIYKMVCCG